MSFALRSAPGLLLLGALTSAGAPSPAYEADPALLAESINGFGCDLYQAVRRREGNLFFSPYSISVALAMARVGAANETAAQMDSVLHLPSQGVARAHREISEAIEPPLVAASAVEETERVPSYELNIAQALWGQQDFPFRASFLATLSDDYHAPLARVDFQKPEEARREINGWVEEQTLKRIRDIISEGQPSPDTRLALANAIHLKASWQHPFKEGRTAEALFTTTTGSQVTARFMHQTANLGYAAIDDVQVISLPYRDRHLSMFILLPRKQSGLAKLDARFDWPQLASWLSALRPTGVHVALPRFAFADSFDLTNTLASMGMGDAFDRDRADFSNMSESALFIGLALHKAFVNVDEQGSEAIAATVVGMALTAAPEGEVIEFRADRPFLFLIRHRDTGVILFLGRVANPVGS